MIARKSKGGQAVKPDAKGTAKKNKLQNTRKAATAAKSSVPAHKDLIVAVPN